MGEGMDWEAFSGMLTYLDAVPKPDAYGRDLVAVPNRWKLVLNRAEEFYRSSLFHIIQPYGERTYYVVDCTHMIVNWPSPDYVLAGPFDNLDAAKTTCYMMTVANNLKGTNYVS